MRAELLTVKLLSENITVRKWGTKITSAAVSPCLSHWHIPSSRKTFKPPVLIIVCCRIFSDSRSGSSSNKSSSQITTADARNPPTKRRQPRVVKPAHPAQLPAAGHHADAFRFRASSGSCTSRLRGGHVRRAPAVSVITNYTCTRQESRPQLMKIHASPQKLLSVFT